MNDPIFHDILILLSIAVFVVVVFQRLHIPPSLGYLLVGALVGPHALQLIPDTQHGRVLAEFGIVFLLFTIGLNFSLPQILTLRHLVFGLGAAQIVLTCLTVGLLAWMFGLSPVAALVVGAAFAQSSTTIISKQLMEQGEDQTQHGRLAVAMSVFQDIMAVPFIVVIPVLGSNMDSLWQPLGWALVKAILACAAIFLIGRWLLKPLFHEVATRRSPELFTLTVLLATLGAAWITDRLGLSLALGAFIAGMMLSETEFRHQVESSIRPFRDVLLGLFFITIGMLLDIAALPKIWYWAVLGAVGLLIIKTVIVALTSRIAGIDKRTALRTGIVLAVGGEFGFAVLSIAILAKVISPDHAQVVLTAILFSMILAPFLIRHNDWLVNRAVRHIAAYPDVPTISGQLKSLRNHVVICGYGRIGQAVGHSLEEVAVPYVALDLDHGRVREAHAAGEPVYYADSAERDILEAVGITSARLLVISHNDLSSTRKVLAHVRALNSSLPVMVRTVDETYVDELLELGATEVVPEALEAGMMISSHALMLVGVPVSRVIRRMRELRSNRYRLLREVFRDEGIIPGVIEQRKVKECLHSVALPERAYAVGRAIREIKLQRLMVTAILHEGTRQLNPSAETVLKVGDVVVLFGTNEDLQLGEARLLTGKR